MNPRTRTHLFCLLQTQPMKGMIRPKRLLGWLAAAAALASSCSVCDASFEVVPVAAPTTHNNNKIQCAPRQHVPCHLHHHHHHALLLQIRGGGRSHRLSGRVARRQGKDKASTLRKVLPWAGAAALASVLFIEYAENINAYVASIKPEWMDMDAFKAKLLDLSLIHI